MNVRLDGDSVRFRITADELKNLQNGKMLRDDINIGESRLALILDPGGNRDQLRVIYEPGSVLLKTSPQKIRELSAMGRSREGLQDEQDGVTIFLQVDFRTQKRKKTKR